MNKDTSLITPQPETHKSHCIDVPCLCVCSFRKTNIAGTVKCTEKLREGTGQANWHTRMQVLVAACLRFAAGVMPGAFLEEGVQPVLGFCLGVLSLQPGDLCLQCPHPLVCVQAAGRHHCGTVAAGQRKAHQLPLCFQRFLNNVLSSATEILMRGPYAICCAWLQWQRDML